MTYLVPEISSWQEFYTADSCQSSICWNYIHKRLGLARLTRLRSQHWLKGNGTLHQQVEFCKFGYGLGLSGSSAPSPTYHTTTTTTTTRGASKQIRGKMKQGIEKRWVGFQTYTAGPPRRSSFATPWPRKTTSISFQDDHLKSLETRFWLLLGKTKDPGQNGITMYSPAKSPTVPNLTTLFILWIKCFLPK